MRIGIVNDMALAREALRRVVLSAPGHEVAWLAIDGAEAVAATRRDRPDLILMDLVMPGVDGAEATRRIMAETPCPILVVTSSVSGNLCKVYDAMGHGALDAVDTPTLGPGGDVDGAATLLCKIATIEKLLGMSPARAARAPALALRPRAGRHDKLVAIGASTGGPNALVEILSALPDDWNASTVLIQHVDSAFAEGLAHWLATRSGRRVEIARNGQRPERGRVCLAGTDDHLVVGPDLRFLYIAEPRALSFRPSVDVFFASLVAHWPEPGVAVLLTGMGRDGATGLLALRDAGWSTMAQDEKTSVIWGMPRAAVELGAAQKVLPVSEIGAAIVAEVSSR
jgi:two-component system, chemotaxis family, response regulator WspF